MPCTALLLSGLFLSQASAGRQSVASSPITLQPSAPGIVVLTMSGVPRGSRNHLAAGLQQSIGAVALDQLGLQENPDLARSQRAGFLEAGGYLSIGAEEFDRAVGRGGVQWRRIPRIGRTGEGMEPFPVTAARQIPNGGGPRLECTTTLFTTGQVVEWAHVSPRNPALAHTGLQYAVSFHDAEPQVVDIIAATGSDDGTMNVQWARNTSDNVNRTATVHTVDRPGVHTLKFWMVDPTVVLQELVVDTGGLRPFLLAPPRSLRLG